MKYNLDKRNNPNLFGIGLKSDPFDFEDFYFLYQILIKGKFKEGFFRLLLF